MPSLLQTLGAPPKRQAVIADCQALIDSEVDSKGGLTGFAIKGAYKLVKGFKPGFVREVVDALLDDFCRKLQPVVDEARGAGRPAGAYLAEHRGRAADALLSITDERARRSRHAVVKGAYDKLRPMAKRHVEEAVPRVGALVEKHAG